MIDWCQRVVLVLKIAICVIDVGCVVDLVTWPGQTFIQDTRTANYAVSIYFESKLNNALGHVGLGVFFFLVKTNLNFVYLTVCSSKSRSHAHFLEKSICLNPLLWLFHSENSFPASNLSCTVTQNNRLWQSKVIDIFSDKYFFLQHIKVI